MSTSGDIMSTSGDVQYIVGYHDTKSLAKGNRFQAFCEMSFSLFRHWLHMNGCSLPEFVEDLHFL